jgi:hypothetical protein
MPSLRDYGSRAGGRKRIGSALLCGRPGGSLGGLGIVPGLEFESFDLFSELLGRLFEIGGLFLQGFNRFGP